MRLTLRTMLAYLDDILEPADAQEIAKKVGESEFATNLMHRIRDVTRRLRLAAPRLEGKGMGLDPNTVAEYLDNTLPGERVPDFEKVCLESDVHLAEVAAAHQILALVLGEPAEVNTGLREKMYAIGADAAKVLTPPPNPRAPQETGVFAEAQSRRKAEVPDYLREPPRSRSNRWLAAAAIVLLVGGAAIVGLNWQRMPWMQRNVAQTETTEPAVSSEPTSDTTATTSVGVAPTSPTATDLVTTPVITPVITPPTVAPPPDLMQPPTATGANVAPPPPTAANNATTLPPTTPNTLPSTVPPVAPPPDVTAATTGTPAVGPPSVPPDAIPSPTLTGTPAVPGSPAAPGTPMPPVAPSPGPEAAQPTTPMPPPPAAPEAVGRLVSEREVLVRFDPTNDTWQRLPTGTTVYTGDRLLAFPTYRPGLALTAGINVQFRGASAVDFMPADGTGIPGLRIYYGRLMLLSVGRPGAEVHLELADRAGTIKFGDGDSTVGIDVQYIHNDGADPEREQAQVIIDLFATSGQVEWIDARTGKSDVIASPATRSLGIKPAGATDAAPGPAVPVWVTGDDRSAIEKHASLDIEEALTTDRPVSLGLKELSSSRRTEDSALASRCLALIGDFDSFVTLLNDGAQRASWNDQVAALREAMAHSPQSAAKIHETYLRLRGAEGEDLYRMLWAYSVPQLQAGADLVLVQRLDHEDLDFRVLAFWNLSRIAGQTFFYRPEYTGAKREQYIIKWRQLLESGKMFPK